MRVPSGAGWLHAMNRFPEREIEPATFVNRLGVVAERHPIEIHAYCALSGHYHVLARVDRCTLHRVLATVETGCGLRPRTPPRVLPVAFGRQLTAVSRYIHLNPVEAGVARAPEGWPHSSYRAYLRDLRAPRWVVTAAVLGRFGDIGARHRYRAYLQAGRDPGSRDRDGRPHPFVGRYEDWRIEPVLTLHAGGPAGPRSYSWLRQISREMGLSLRVSAPVPRSPRCGGAAAARARGALVQAARRSGGHSLREIAAFLGYGSPESAAAAARRFDRAASGATPSS